MTMWTVPAPGPQGVTCKKPVSMSLKTLRTDLGLNEEVGWWTPLLFEEVVACPPAIPCSAVCDWKADDAVVRSSTFSLADKAHYPALTLEHRNATGRCFRCHFDEVTHVYTVDGIRVPWSGTTFSHMCEKGFDADGTLDEYYGEDWARRKGLVHEDGAAFTREEVKESWRANGEVQSRRGTLMHWHIECHLNGYTIVTPHSIEFRMYLHFEREFMRPLGLEPWRTEMNLFHCGLRLAGQADLVCRLPDGRLVILDWKRSREIKSSGFMGAKQRPPLAQLPDCNLWTYCLQLNTYRHMLESEYEHRVAGMFIVVLHPEQKPLGAHVYQVPRLEVEISALVEHAAAIHGTSTESQPGPLARFDIIGLRF